MRSVLNVSASMSGPTEAYEDVGEDKRSIDLSLRFSRDLKSGESTLQASVAVSRLLVFLDESGFDVQRCLADAIQCLGEAGDGEDGTEALVYMGDELYEAARAVQNRRDA